MENNKGNKQIDKPTEGLSIAGLEAFVKKATAESGTARTKREDKGLSLAEMEKWVEEQQKMADEKAKRKAEEEAIFGPLNRQIEQGINKLAQTSAEREAFFEDLDRKMYEQDKAKLSNKPKNGIESAIAAMPISTDAKVQKEWESIKDEHDFQGWRENNILQYQARQAEEIAEVLGVVYPERGVGPLYQRASTVLGKGIPYAGPDGDVLNRQAELIKELGLWEQGMTEEDFLARHAELSKEFDKYRPQGPVKIESDFPAKRDLKWYEAMMSEQALKDVSPLIKDQMSDDGTVLLGDKSVDANALAYAMANERMADIHNYLMDVDERYSNLIFEKTYGKTFEQYVNDTMAEEFEKLLTRYKQLAEDYKRKKVDSASNKFEAGLNSMGVPKLLQKPFIAEYEMELGWAVDSSLDDVIEDMEAAKASGNWSQFWKGADVGFDLYNTLTFGLNELVNAGSKYGLYEKKRRIDNGASETWSYDEELLYELYEAEDRIKGLANYLGYKKSSLAKLGEGLGTTAEILPQFALGMTATGGIGAGVKYKAGQAAKRYMANKTIANAAGVAYHGTIDLGKWVSVNYARGMVAAPLMPMFYKGVLDEYNSQYHFEGGELFYTPKNKASMWAGAYIDTVNEVASEGMGTSIGNVVGLGLKGTGRMLGIAKKANKSVTGVATRRFLQSPMKESTKKLLRDMGYGGSLTGEWTGEMLGDLMSQWQRYMVGADYDFEHFKDFDTWLTTIGVSAIMGGTMTTLGGGMTIYQETKMAKDIAQNRERIINNKIQDAALRDKLRMLSEMDDPMLAASELATFFQTHHIENASDKAYALDYIMLNSQLKVIMGDVQEQERMVKFEAKRSEIEGKAYHGADGKSTRNVVIVRDAEGNAYYVLRGDMANKEAMLELMDVNTGEMTTKVASAVMEPVSASVDSLLINAYGNMFSLEEEVSHVKDVTGALSSVENPTMEHVETTAMQLDITLPKKGDVVTMVDGRTAEITEDLGDGTYIAQRKASLTGESETITLPFDAIRSNDSLTAKAQETILNNGVESAVDATSTPQAPADVQTPVESATPQPTTQTPSGVSVGAVIVAPNGEQARVVEINDDGTVTLNYNLNEGASMADAAIEVVRMDDLTKEDGSDASANVPTTAQTEMPQPAVPQPVAEMPTTDAVDAAQNVEVVPTQQDGTIDFDAIDDPAQCAQLMAAMLGGPENALAIVEESIEAVKAEMDKAVKAKAPTINEGVAKQNKVNEIKARLIRYEQIAFELEQMMKPAEAKSEAKAENMEHEAGLVENEHTAGLPEGMRKSIDEMAKRAKVRIEFVDERIKGDAEQKGNLIRVSTHNRTKAVEVLVGHEMLHFMKSKMPEAYEAFKEAVIAFMGKDKFAKEVERRKKAYAAQNVKLNDEDAAEEIVADYAGFLVQGRDVFEKFIEPKKSDNVFLRGLKKGLEYIRNIFGANGMTKQVNAVDNMVDTLNTLINATVEGKDIEKREETSAETTKNEEATAEETKGEKTKHSLIGEIGAKALDMAEEATTRLDNLAVAREMETSGKDAKAIRMATGWERGGDGKWRYEIMEGITQTMIDDAHNRGVSETTLGELLGEDNPIIKSYPDMKDMKVEFIEATEDELPFLAAYDMENDSLYLSQSGKNIEAVAHEIQHAIQVREGFAIGGQQSGFDTHHILPTAEQQALADKLIRQHTKRITLSKEEAEQLGYEDRNIEEVNKEKAKEELTAHKEELGNMYEAAIAGLEEAKTDEYSDVFNATQDKVKQLIDKAAAYRFEQYQKLAGEVESRNVEKRLNMTPEERRATLLSETEDVAREDQIFLREGAEMAMSQPKFSLPSLVGVHNLSLDKLRKVIKMGGLANPSVAVIDVDKQTHDDYGEYSLILPKNMVDARQGKNAGTWAGDAWTPTYPQIVKRMNDDKAYSRFHKDIEALPEAMRNRVRLDFDSFMDGRDVGSLAYWYLYEKGVNPALVAVPSRYSDEVINALSEATNGTFNLYNLTPEERAKCLDVYIDAKYNGDKAAYEAEVQSEKERLIGKAETVASDRVKKWALDKVDELNEYGFDYSEVSDFVRDVETDMRNKGTVNVEATIRAAKEQIENGNLIADYNIWLESLDERYGIKEYIFNGYTNNGDRKYLPHTVENASKWMKKQGRNGAVATFPSFGVFIANAIPKMTTLESIRKRKEMLGKSNEAFEAFKDKWLEVYHELGNKLQPDAKGFDDYGYWRLIEAVGKNNPKEFIKKEYGIELSEEDMAKFNDMVNAIRTEYPARYFETKFERPLQLSDFVAAVVPNDMPMDVYGRFKDANVEMFEYEKGNNNSRAEAMQKASEMENVRFSLMDDAQAAAEIVPYLEAYNNDLTTFNALVNKVKDVAEKYPNATWPERFLKENYEDENEDDFINRLKWTISNYAIEEENDYSEEKQTIEETFGGIWIENTEEFAKFVSAVNKSPFEEDGEGIAYTDNYFYAYYRSIDGQPIPFASVYMNKDESQDIVNTILKAKRNGEKRGIRRYFDRAYERARHISGKNDGDLGTNKELSNPRRNDRLDSELSRYGAYYDSPELFVKSKRTYKGSRINYSLITPEMDAAYLDAVERGDMATAQRMVMEAAKLAMPNTKVVDEDGNPKVVYHQTNATVYINRETGQNWDELDWRERMEWDERDDDDWYEYWEERDFNTFSRVNARTTQELDGFFFAPEYDEYHEYGDRTISAFLNITNPASFGDYNIDSSQNNAGRDERIRLQNEGYDGVINEEDGAIWEYVAFSPNQIKSADPVTYDDAGNVIPLSERFNPEKEDIRYSLRSMDEGMAILRNKATEYNIDIPFILVENASEYVAMMQEMGMKNAEKKARAFATYIAKERLICFNGSHFLDADADFIENAILHEYTHHATAQAWDEVIALVATMNRDDILWVRDNMLTEHYNDIPAAATINEIISTFVEEMDAKMRTAAFKGEIEISKIVESVREEIAKDAEIDDKGKGVLIATLPLVAKALEFIKEKYNGERETAFVLRRDAKDRANGNRMGEESETKSQEPTMAMRDGDGRDREYSQSDRNARKIGTVDTRYSLSDIPFFDAEGNAIDMSAISEAKAHEMIDGRVRDMMVYDYDKSVIDITNQAKKDRRATRAYYAEERRKRRGGNEAPRTNAAKTDKLFADTNINSLPLEVQALIFIAEGRAKIRWADKDGKRGLASELGLTNSAGDKAAMKNIWSGAEQSFDEVVHGWWESINGYERGIDTQDLRNALIDALMSFPSAKAAMRELQSQYDTIATAEREALEEIDRREAADLERVKREYEERSARFEVSEGEEREAMREMAVEHYSSQPMSAADEALEELTDKLNKMERKAERLMLEQKSGYRELAESIEKSKEVIIRTLENLRMFSGMEQIHIDEVAKLINMTRTARSKRQVEAVATKAKNLIQRIAIRKARENMRRLLDLKLSNVEVIQQILKESNTLPREERDALLKSLWKVSRNGWRATKAVHPDTKEIFKELNDLIKEYKKSVKDKEVATIKQTITDRLASLEAELHPDVEVDDKGNVIDNAGLPTDFNDNNKNIALLLFKSYLEVEAKNAAYSEAIKTLRDTKKGSDEYGAAVANMYASRDAYLSAVKQFNATLEDVIVNGKDKLRDFNIEKEKHEVALRSMAINAIGGKKASAQGKRGNALQLARAGYNISVNAPYWTFETVLERIDRLSPYKKGEFYNYFMRKYTDANAKLYTSYTAHMESIGSAMARCFPDMAKQFGIIGRNPYEIYKAVMRKAEATDLGTLKYMEGDVEREMQLTVANAMYIVAMWRQPRYREAMEANGITEVAINNLMQSINKEHAGYINFMDWVNTALLPNTRLEYDEVYRKLNGGSLAKEENYFPARVVTHEDVKLDENGKGQLPSSPTALKERISHKTMPKMGTDYFKVLEAHIQDMDKWAAFAELTADLNVILSSDEFRRRLNEFMPGIGGDGGGKGSLYKMLYDTALIATGNYHNSGENVFGLIQKTWATSNIAFRLWTAVKQISSVSVGATERGYFIKHMLAASTVAGIAYEWQRAMALSPSLRYRWQSKAAGMEALMRETSRGDGYARYRGGVIKTYDALKDMADKAVKLGMTPNALVDAIACSILVNSVYDKAIHDMTKGEREATEEERKEAIRKAEIAFNSTQQSSEGAYLSAAQANPLYAPLTTYMNASFALHRKRMSGIHELLKLMTSKKYKRFLKDEYGVDAAKISAKDAFADIIRGIVGDLSFAAMGWGLMEVMSAVYEWLGGDGDDDDTEAEKQAFFETYWMPALNGFLGGGIATSIMQGFDTSMTPAYDELLGDIGGIFDDKGDWRGEVAQFATKYGLGIDLKSLYRIGAGLQNMVAEEDDENAGSILMFLNAPNKYIKAFVGDRREGETMEQYQTRIMRLYTLFDKVVYEELSDENGDYIGEDAPSMIMSQTQAEDLKKEYEPSRLKDVVVRYGGWDEYKAMMNTEMLYKDICEFIGVTPDAKPSKVKLRNTVYSTGEYVEPVDGLTEKEHDNLLDGQGDIYEAHYYRTRWIGDDEGYYELLSEEYKRKNGLIEKYNEYIK